MISANDGQALPTLQQSAEQLGETIRLSYAIADEAAVSDIESFGRPAQDDDGWYDIAPYDRQERYHAEALIRAARYLTLRRRLEVDPVDCQRVRVKS